MNSKRNGKIEPYQLFLSAFGMGFMPFAPGTWGSAWCVLVFFLIALLLDSTIGAVTVLIVLFIYGFWATIYFGDKGIEQYGDDPGMIVSDEVCGQAVALAWLCPWGSVSTINFGWYCLAGFILFRIFDIIKPWPASYFDRLKTKWGVLLDDVVAGIYAAIIVQIIARMCLYTPLPGVNLS